MRRARADSGLGRRALLRGWWRLRRSGRRLLLSEYLAFGLYREDARPGDFLGVIEATKLSLAINHRNHRRALVRDKLLFDAMLRGLGYPVPDLQAVLSPLELGGGFASLRTAADLRGFLMDQARFPLFCKPVRGQGGKDSFAITEVSGGAVAFLDGTEESLFEFCDRAAAQFGAGMLIQSMVDQHPALTEVCGPVAATLRLFTFFEVPYVHVLAGGWKIPTGGGMADNIGFGSYTANVGIDTGRVGTVRAAPAPGAEIVTRHPVSGAAFDGLTIPFWEEAKDLSARAARLLYGMPLVGWDIAIGRDGPVIIEANSVPGLEAIQYLDLEGFLRGGMLDRMEREVARLKFAAKSEARGRRKKVRGLVIDRVLTGIGFDR